ncbi:MAG: class I SAM-dependent methyltransferase [Alphaproteobacteria bacterium]|nr:class I SAM-dependent methyltransferase [Alphaproteobacteria bacterium]
MSTRTLSMSDALVNYLLAVSPPEPPLLARLRAETARLPDAGMQIAPEQGLFLRLLIRLTGATRCLEVGTFTGYSALVIASTLPPKGRLTCCDISKEYTDIALRYWDKAGLTDKISLRLGPALETLPDLLDTDGPGSFDFAFIDADKENYVSYYERCMELIRPGGLIAVDNVLWGGAVIDRARTDADTEGVRALNEHVCTDRRVTTAMVPIGDGMTLAMKNP